MKVLVIGNGGREHAICWKLRQSTSVQHLFCAPGSDAIAQLAECIALGVTQVDQLVEFAKAEKIDLTVVGPELPLTLGIVDKFKQAGLNIFGPTQLAAQIEGSKSFCKQVVQAAGVATAKAEVFKNIEAAKIKVSSPVVLKVDGLAAGKGVFVCPNDASLQEAIKALEAEYSDQKILAEELLSGVEISVIVATDGKRFVPLSSAHDYKRIFDYDQGANTGGMGTVSPSPRASDETLNQIYEKVIEPVVREMNRRETPFCGFLYAGIMLGQDGVARVIEFNARMGDPECQVILPRMRCDFAQFLFALATQAETLPQISWDNGSAVCVVLAAAGYPAKVQCGDQISGLELAEQLNGVKVFHAGTKKNGSQAFFTAGGRVLNVTAMAASLPEARALAYRAADMIQFRGRQLRRDIAVS